jgi:hypothetical protein
MSHWQELLSRGDGCCDLLARLKEAYDGQHAEIERLRALNARLAEFAAAEMEITNRALGVPRPSKAPQQ